MSTPTAVGLFQSNWFLRQEEPLVLSDAEQAFIVAALGSSAKRWGGSPDVARMAKLLAEHPDVLSRIGTRLVKVAIGMRGCGPAVRFLLEHGVLLEVDESAYNVLHEAAWAGAEDTLRSVFEAGAADATVVSVRKPHTGWPDNLSLMYWAAWGGYPDVARLLIEHGAGVHHELAIKGNGERGVTSLHEAVAPGPWAADDPLRSNARKLEVARILIDDGAEYDVFTASALNDTERLQALIDANPSVAKAAGEYGMTPLHWAARAGSVDCVAPLLTYGADINFRNKTARAPLQLAAEQDQADVIRLLADQGADLDTQDKKGRTPLHRATYEGKVAAAETLLSVGANSQIVNKRGKTAFEIARKGAKYLKSA